LGNVLIFRKLSNFEKRRERWFFLEGSKFIFR
jgi:hypothetical protein